MKVKTISNARLAHKGHRFDSKPFMSGVLEARVILDRLAVEKMPLCEVTKGHKGGIYNGPQFSRVYVDSPEHGVPFVGSSSMLMADLSNLPLLSKKHACSPGLSYLRLEEGMTLISCSGTVGRMVYVRPDMADIWSSQHIMKVVPDPDKTPPGYLYACLSGKFGVPQVVSGTYGAIIQHIEPEYMKDLSVPRLGEEVENAAENLMRQSIAGRERCNILLNRATSLLFDKIGMEDIRAFDWHSKGADISFVDKISHPQSFRALNFNPRYKALVTRLKSMPHHSLGDICAGGDLGAGARFKRIDADPEYGVKLVGQKQGFWSRPVGRWISANHAPADIFVKDETVLIAAQGTLGENEVFCRPLFITGKWLDYVYTQHFIRVRSGDLDISGAYLFAFFRSETAFRCLRSMSIGSKQQDIHLDMLKEFPVPVLDRDIRKEIEEMVKEAFELRDDADNRENEAVALVESAIEQYRLP